MLLGANYIISPPSFGNNIPFALVIAGKAYCGYRTVESACLIAKPEKNAMYGKCYYNFNEFLPIIEDNRFWINKSNIKAWFDLTGNIIDVDYPVLYVSRDKIISNPHLRDFQFQTILDGTQIYQEIEMFLSAKQKGFDCYSFKHKPSKRKEKVCKK